MGHQICDTPDCDKPAKWLIDGPASPDLCIQLCDEHAFATGDTHTPIPKESHR